MEPGRMAAATRVFPLGEICWGLFLILSKRPLEASGELKPAMTSIEGIAVDGNAVIEPQRAKLRDQQPQADAPVVIVGTGAKITVAEAERIVIDHADVVKGREPEPFDDRHAVFGRGKPRGVAPDRFAQAPRADFTVTIAAQGFNSTQEIPVKERHVRGATEAVGGGGARAKLQHVTGEESFEVPRRPQFQFIEIPIP